MLNFRCAKTAGWGRRLVALGCLAVLSGGLAACSTTSKTPPAHWSARPAVVWNQVCENPVAPPQNGYRVVLAEPTTGLFPANMAVTRVAIAEEGTRAGKPMLFADPRNEFLQWNRAFDDQMAVSEVFPIDQRDLGGGPAEPVQILAACRALHARLGLIYAVNETSPFESEMIGALYDTRQGRLLAVIHAEAHSVTPTNPDLPLGPWETDSRALVRKNFEEYTYSAVYELIQQDRAVRSDPPEGWIPAGPIKPVEWPPRPRRIP
jgi:hypothetical protein